MLRELLAVPEDEGYRDQAGERDGQASDDLPGEGLGLALGRAEVAGLTPLSATTSTLLGASAQVAVWAAVVLCVVRGIPVLMDSRAYLEPAGDGPAPGNAA